ncbi:MAG: glycogen debranching protein [Planctomycetota bacterium]|nr:MAG: glycogen debranching protein [Planctomycetota bacterium]
MPTSLAPTAVPSGPALLRVGREELLRLEHALTREWLETDGLGGFASSTILMCPTRRYHGLLAAVPPGHSRRHLFLARFEETLHAPGRELPLSMARYPGVWAPRGHRSITGFELRPWPASRFHLGLAEPEREVLMVRGRPVVLVRWSLAGQRNGLELRFRPLLAFRELDALTFENLDLDPRAERIPGGIRCRPYASLPPLHLTVSVSGGHRAEFEADPVWYRRLEYAQDLARGYDGHEDQFSPGWFHAPLEPGGEIVAAATIGPPVADPAALWRQEAARRRAELPSAVAGGAAGVGELLAATADHFLYRDPTGRPGVLAGFPWFGEWGRDTFIALPGLTLARGRVEACAEVLRGALPFLRDGLLPNIFGPTPAASHYGSADAAFWFARAVRLWQLAGGDREELLDAFLPALRAIAEACLAGTDLGLHVDPGGLLEVGGPDLNPTWMDAVTSTGPVTPRHGQPVEIEALWYFLLAYLERLELLAGDPAAAGRWTRRKRLAGRTFRRRFWLPQHYLADCWREGLADPAVRPNMVLAAALEFSPLTRARRRDVVERAEAELLTPRGLRTLSPADPAYRGHYRGGPEERDAAYHQGTAWPWLLGFWAEAALRGSGPRRWLLDRLERLVEGFRDALGSHGLGFLSEVHDGDSPHRHGGCPAQAWSCAEILRLAAMVRDHGLPRESEPSRSRR